MVALKIAARAILLGLTGGVATFLLWAVLNIYWWAAYRRTLRATGWFETHDVGFTYLIAFGPPQVGIIFAVAFALIEAIERVRHRTSLPTELLLGVAAPCALVLDMNLFGTPLRWHYPGAEVSVALIGACLVGLRRLFRARFQW